MPKSIASEVWITVGKAASMMAVNRSTIYDWINEKKILPQYVRINPSGIYIINTKGLVRPTTARHRKSTGKAKVRVRKLTF